MHTGRRRLLLIAAALLLVIPCAAAGVFAFHLNIGSANAQEPSSADKQKREIEERARMDQMKELREKEDQELRERIQKEANPEIKANLEAELKARLEQRNSRGYAYTMTGPDGQSVGVIFDAKGNGWRAEREQEAKQQAVLASLARISMDRAIQIAVSQTPGKVFECSLVAERWEGPGELAKPSRVFYHVVILTGDESKPTTTHVLVSALDGTIVKADQEDRRKVNVEGGQLELRAAMTSSSGESRIINGGVLNGKTKDMPLPEYPVIARAAHASGAVTVEIMIDEGGNVIAAKAVSGHPLLQAAAVNAARQATFTPTRLNGEPVRVTGVMVYNFVAQ